MKSLMKKLVALVMALFVVASTLPMSSISAFAADVPDSPEVTTTTEMALGSDISNAATTNRLYYGPDGVQKPLYSICADDFGMNAVRLRTWVQHRTGQCSEDAIVAYAKKCNEAGLRVMIDFHYADDWADPGKQPPPVAWAVTDDTSAAEAERVGKLLYDYTYSFMKHMVDEGVTPEWVQIGNEITNGMLWPLCNIGNYDNFAYVLNQGIAAVRAASPETKIVLHIDNGAQTDTVVKWYEDIIAAGVTDFDVIGLSFYPRDHDPTNMIKSLSNTFAGLYEEFCKDTDREIQVVEIGANYLDNCTVNQKYNMILNVINALRAIPDNRGTGCFYWEIENYEMTGRGTSQRPNAVWSAFSPDAKALNANPVQSMELSASEISVEENDIYLLELAVTPANPDITRMEWVSSDESVCTVDSSGMVKGIAPGEATITVSNYAGDDGSYEVFTRECKVTVTEEKPGLKNGGFELGDNGIWKFAEGNQGVPTLGVSSNKRTGLCSLHFTGGTADLDFRFYQDIEGLEPGVYKLTGMVMGDTGVSTIKLTAETTEGEILSDGYKTIGWGGSANFVPMTLDGIVVEDGKLRVGAVATATYVKSEAWGDFDDFALEYVGPLPIGEAITDVVVNTTVRPTGHCLETIEATVTDPALLEGLTAEDFEFAGQAAAWMSPTLHDFTATVSDIAVEGNKLTLTISDFYEKYFYVGNFTVTCKKDRDLTILSEKVSNVITPVADDFQAVRKADGAAIDYNIYAPEADEPLPVVIAFHGYGDTDNTLQNRVALSWAMPENQAEHPAYVIAPVIANYGATSREAIYEGTYDVVQQLIADGKVDPTRVYVVGKSYGGMATYEFTEKYADDVAAAIAMCGAVSASKTIVANADRLVDIPLWIAQAVNDDTVRSQQNVDLYNQLVAAGSTVVKSKFYTDEEMNAWGVDGKRYGYHTVEIPVCEDKEYHDWLFAQQKPSGKAIKDVVVNTTVRPTGHCLENIVVTVSDPALLEGLTAEDFQFAGQAAAWMSPKLHDFTATVSDIAVAGNKLTITISDFYEKYFYVDNFTVTCTKDFNLTVTSDKVSKVNTPVADDFKEVRKADGAAIDYNIYDPKASEPVPVVIAFHGYGDTDNTLQNRVALSWAMPENQAEHPCYVVAPVIANYGAASREAIYEGTYEVVQRLIANGKVDPERVYVVGKSYGGMATYEFTEKYADDIAGAIAMCGAISASKTIVANADRLVDVPLWIAQAVNDDTVKSQQNVDLYNQLVEAGSTVVKSKFYTDEEMNAWGVDGKRYGYHTVEIPVCEDPEYHDWLFAQKLAPGKLVEDVVVNTTVRPTGHCLETLEVTVSDPSALAGLKASDFTFAGQAAAWLNPRLHDFTATVSDIAVDGNKLTITISDFYEKYFYVGNFTVTCNKNSKLTVTSDKISVVNTPVADDFQAVRKADGAAIDYNIYAPESDKPLPVVIAFHGYGDTDNTLQNRVALSWALPENQAKNPCYVIAPVIANYGAASREAIYEGTHDVVKQLIAEGKVDASRVYVVGKSYGGMATYEYTEKYASEIAGAIAMCGAVSASKTIVENADALVNVPLWIAQAVNDDTVKSQQNVDLYNQLVDAGSKVVKSKFYTDEEMNAWGVDGKRYGYHTVEIPVCEDPEYHDWLFAQKLPAGAAIEDVVVNTTVRPTGHCLETIEVTVAEGTDLEGLTAADFQFNGQAAAWMSPQLHDFTATVADVAVDGNKLTITISDFYEKYFYVGNFTVTCKTNNALTVTSDKVSKVNTPVADDFEEVRMADGAAVDYNIYDPHADKAVPVVIAFHGFGDTDNTLQNRVALSWALPENQAKNPCYVIAPVINNYFSPAARDEIYTGVYDVVQELIAEGKVDGRRIYVVGKSFGGMAVYEFTEKYVDDVAAAIAMCGAIGFSPSAKANLESLVNTPFWIAQAINDDTVGYLDNLNAYQTLLDAGSTVVKCKFYTDAEMNAWGVDGKRYGYHTVEIPVCEDQKYHDWLFAQAKQVPAHWEQNEEDLWYYVYDDGTCPVNKWEMINGKWYHFDAEGMMDYGWKAINGKWYYFGSAQSGSMRTGWQYIDNKWYYFGTDGAMKTGWQTYKDKWYYLSSSGAMLTGWQKINNVWYYLGGENDGAMKTGWQLINEKWYYMDPTSGAMAANTWIGNYYVNASGVWTQTR